METITFGGPVVIHEIQKVPYVNGEHLFLYCVGFFAFVAVSIMLIKLASVFLKNQCIRCYYLQQDGLEYQVRIVWEDWTPDTVCFSTTDKSEQWDVYTKLTEQLRESKQK